MKPNKKRSRRAASKFRSGRRGTVANQPALALAPANLMKFYGYKNCDTCRKAKKWLQERGIAFDEIPIREQPPTVDELRRMLPFVGNDIKKLFNTSSKDYRALGGKAVVEAMAVGEALSTLHDNGNLIKRPFVLTEAAGLVGFKPDVWEAELPGS